jgi:hypothetical protein
VPVASDIPSVLNADWSPRLAVVFEELVIGADRVIVIQQAITSRRRSTGNSFFFRVVGGDYPVFLTFGADARSWVFWVVSHWLIQLRPRLDFFR